MRLTGRVKGRRNGVEIEAEVGVDEQGELSFKLEGGVAGGRARIPAVDFELDRGEFNKLLASLDTAHGLTAGQRPASSPAAVKRSRPARPQPAGKAAAEASKERGEV